MNEKRRPPTMALLAMMFGVTAGMGLEPLSYTEKRRPKRDPDPPVPPRADPPIKPPTRREKPPSEERAPAVERPPAPKREELRRMKQAARLAAKRAQKEGV